MRFSSWHVIVIGGRFRLVTIHIVEITIPKITSTSSLIDEAVNIVAALDLRRAYAISSWLFSFHELEKTINMVIIKQDITYSDSKKCYNN